ncbi:hypothetical protein [Rhizobium sp. IBUN]|uniref:hypothetical protein n=1 Tax=Rhizobium sp. IBUN TaxID=1042326 RepID=UPI0012EB75AF|nr:hypothetical protein [Rhizobium sp. IBUN]
MPKDAAEIASMTAAASRKMSLRRFQRAAQMLKPAHRISDKTVLCQQQSPDHRELSPRHTNHGAAILK